MQTLNLFQSIITSEEKIISKRNNQIKAQSEKYQNNKALINSLKEYLNNWCFCRMLNYTSDPMNIHSRVRLLPCFPDSYEHISILKDGIYGGTFIYDCSSQNTKRIERYNKAALDIVSDDTSDQIIYNYISVYIIKTWNEVWIIYHVYYSGSVIQQEHQTFVLRLCNLKWYFNISQYQDISRLNNNYDKISMEDAIINKGIAYEPPKEGTEAMMVQPCPFWPIETDNGEIHIDATDLQYITFEKQNLVKIQEKTQSNGESQLRYLFSLSDDKYKWLKNTDFTNPDSTNPDTNSVGKWNYNLVVNYSQENNWNILFYPNQESTDQSVIPNNQVDDLLWYSVSSNSSYSTIDSMLQYIKTELLTSNQPLIEQDAEKIF